MNNLIRTLILILTASFCSFVVQSAPLDDFVITVKANDNDTFKIPTIGAGFDYSVDCNDDGVDEISHASTDYICDYGLSLFPFGF